MSSKKKGKFGKGSGSNTYQGKSKVAVASPRPILTLPARDTLKCASTVPALRFDVTVTLLEDMHSGSGVLSLDSVSQQTVSASGAPVVLGSSIKGLMRREAETLCKLGLCSRDEVVSLFGDGVILARGAAVWSHWTTDALDVFHEVSSTALEDDHRGPKERTLRTVQFVKAGCVFRGTIHVSDTAQRNLVESCLRRLTGLGAGQRHGDGRVRTEWQVTFVNEEANNEKANSEETDRRRIRRPLVSSGVCRLRLVVEALGTLTIPTDRSNGSEIRCDSVIPGSALRGAWVQAFQRMGIPPSETLSADWLPDVLPAFPVPMEQGRHKIRLSSAVFPVHTELSLFRPPAQKEVDWPWWADAEQEDASVADTSSRKTKKPDPLDLMFQDNRGGWHIFRPTMRTDRRNNGSERQRRGWDKPALFSMEGFVEGTRFLADLVFQSPQQAEVFVEKAGPVLTGNQPIRVGRGGTPVKVVDVDWASSQDSPKWEKGVIGYDVWMLSDWVLRGPYGGFWDGIDTDVLGQILSLSPDDAARLQLEGKGPSAELRTGFNATSGLPRYPAWALKRGGIIKIRLRQDMERTEEGDGVLKRLRATLDKLRWRGVGDCLEEGCGRFGLHPVWANGDRRASESYRLPSHAAPWLLDVPSLKTSEDEIYKQVEALGASILEGLSRSGAKDLSKSQLSGLIALVSRPPVDWPRIRNIFTARATRTSGESWKSFDFFAIQKKWGNPDAPTASELRVLVGALDHVHRALPRSSKEG